MCIKNPDNSDVISLHGGSDLNETANQLFINESNMQDSERDIAEDEAIMKDINYNFANCEDTGKPVTSVLHYIVNDVVRKPITTEKHIKKLELYLRPENLEGLKVKKNNLE